MSTDKFTILDEVGRKDDSAKLPLAQILKQFPNALELIGAVGAFGADKYGMGNWKLVENKFARYEDAFIRHWLQFNTGEVDDVESRLPHLAHLAWNALAILEIHLTEDGGGLK